ncbi:MAG: hypothetical protein GEV10_26365 [Streptosporangiales bacterium]|nr:hypothetical protein [Streptosporangiales bacterium]
MPGRKMLHRTNWGAFVGGLVLLTIAGLFLLDTLTDVSVPLYTIAPLLLIGLGLASILNRRFERGTPPSTTPPSSPGGGRP